MVLLGYMVTFNSALAKPLKWLISTEKDAVALLAGVAVVALACYWSFFTVPFGLLKFYDQPLLDLRQISQTMPLARWWLLAGFLAQALLYWLGWHAAQRASGWLAWLLVIGGALAFGGVLLGMQPFGAADLFDNILHGRVLGIYGANPFHYAPAAFPADPFLRYVAWQTTPSAYGPLWEVLAGGTAWLAGDGILRNILFFKLLSALFWGGNGVLVSLILRTYAPERALAGLLLFAWNPVILYETMGNGHNDIAMIFWVLLAAWLLLRRHHTLGILAILVGALFKFIPVLLLPAAGLIALRELPDWRQRGLFIARTAFWALLLVGLAYLPFWVGPETLALDRRQQLLTTSLPALVYAWLLPHWGARISEPISQVAASLVLLFALGQGVLAGRNPGWLNFIQAAFAILLFYLLVSCLWFQTWYAIWPLTLAALLPPGHAARLGVLLGFGVLTKPLLFEPIWLWVTPLPPKAWREVRLGPAVLGLPWLYALFIGWQSLRQRRSLSD